MIKKASWEYGPLGSATLKRARKSFEFFSAPTSIAGKHNTGRSFSPGPASLLPVLSAEALAGVNLATGARRGEAGIFERGYKCRRNADRLRDSEGDTLPSEDPLVRRLPSGRSNIDIACNTLAGKRKEEVDWRGKRGMGGKGSQAHLFGNKGNCPRSREESLDSRGGEVRMRGE